MGPLETPLAATLFAGALLLPSSHGVLVNITVDDTNPDPITNNVFTYSPMGAWHQGNNCSVCFRKLNSSQTHDGTWHDTTYAASQAGLDEVQVALFEFTGSAIYVYGIETVGSSANISYYIDGQFSGETVYYTSPVDENTYNSLLYSNTTIPLGAHSFELKNGGGGGIASQLLFDYIVYTRETDNSTTTSPNSQPASSTPTPTSSQGTPTPIKSSGATIAKAHGANDRTIVIASVIPSGVVLIALIVLFLWRQRNARRMLREKSEPFMTQGAFHTSPVTRMAHGDYGSEPGLALATSNTMLLQHGQQPLADDAPAEESSVPLRSKTTRTTRTSPPEYNALFPAE